VYTPYVHLFFFFLDTSDLSLIISFTVINYKLTHLVSVGMRCLKGWSGGAPEDMVQLGHHPPSSAKNDTSVHSGGRELGDSPRTWTRTVSFCKNYHWQGFPGLYTASVKAKIRDVAMRDSHWQSAARPIPTTPRSDMPSSTTTAPAGLITSLSRDTDKSFNST